MNIVEAWDGFTSSEKLMFQNCCRKILRRTFLVRDKQDDRKHYFFVVNHIDSFLNYFSFMGFEVKCDKDNGVVMLDNCSEIGDKDKLQSNRYRFTKEETIVLCCLWLLYVSRIKEGTLSSVIVIGVSDLIYELEKYDARDMVNKTALQSFLSLQLLQTYGGESNLWQATDTYLSHTLVQSTPLQSLHFVLQSSSSPPHKFFTVQCLTLLQSFPLG